MAAYLPPPFFLSHFPCPCGAGCCALCAAAFASCGAGAARQELEQYHDRLLEGYRQRLSGTPPVLHRMRELWNYLSGSFEGTDRPLKAIRKAKDLPAYEAAAQEILRSCPLKDAK